MMNHLVENAAMANPGENGYQVKFRVPEERLEALERNWTNITEEMQNIRMHIHFDPATLMLIVSCTPEERNVVYLESAKQILTAFLNGYRFEDALWIFHA